MILVEDREFLMMDDDFNQISELAFKYSGIVLAENKRDMVYSRIARRVRALKLKNFSEYLNYLEKNHHREVSEFINVLTTNLTSFFRESHHFHYLKKELLPKLLSANNSSKRLRIWSAGCSIGQEVYSIAITLKEFGFPDSWDIKMLATDLDSDVLETGKSGIYPADHVSSMSQSMIKRFFCYSSDHRSVRVKDQLKKHVYFKRLNLIEEWPMKGPFDIIFCRNVVIYFNKDTQKVLFDRYANMLPIGGHLFIGHSESLNGITDRFENIGQTIYRKVK